MSETPDWAEQARRLLAGAGQFLGSPAAGAPHSEGGATHEGHAGDCRWCPVCTVVGVVRGERPELATALADVLATAAGALRTFAESSGSAQSAAPPPPAGGEAAAAAGESEPPPVQHIGIA